MKPRLLIVGRSRYRLPLEPNLERKFAALRAELELRVLASARDGSPLRDDTFSLAPPRRALDGPRFWVSLPLRVRRELAAFRPDAVLVQSPYEAAAVVLAQPRCPVVVEIHGDWRTATRLYGSRARRPAAPLADRIARAALRRVDAVRTISSYTSSLVRAAGVEPAAEFPAFIDLDPFLAPPAPLPEQPRALFVGVLERYKDVDGLAAAWRLAAPRLPRATLRLVGRGSRAHVAERLVAELPRQTAWIPELPNAAVPAELDAATILVLPSRSEGLGRVVVEALCRGRPVVATRVGGIVDLVRDGENGLLVEPRNPRALAEALVRCLSDRALAGRLAAAARPSVQPWLATPEEYARRVRELVERVLAGRRQSACAEAAG
ncbi:MAG TPA: glycosyltransferase family 4 protein [Gaiellaceae bacterium]|nr:glycosyltransferase family 4 protein [Gaiellaceae bacterium]